MEKVGQKQQEYEQWCEKKKELKKIRDDYKYNMKYYNVN